MLLEICANSYQSALNAQLAGAHRIELCQELAVGGITPSYGLIEKVIRNVTIPVFVLIRPRSGNFVFSDAEFDIMKKDIQICKELGCQGIVSGILNTDFSIDIKRTKTLVELSRPLEFTFHRAFDEVENPEVALAQLIDLGVERILTSGQAKTAEQGIKLIERFHHKAKELVSIMAGAGVNATNASKFMEIGLTEIHSSASVEVYQPESLFSLPQSVSDVDKIKQILRMIY